jgi:hypothetical protein
MIDSLEFETFWDLHSYLKPDCIAATEPPTHANAGQSQRPSTSFKLQALSFDVSLLAVDPLEKIDWREWGLGNNRSQDLVNTAMVDDNASPSPCSQSDSPILL